MTKQPNRIVGAGLSGLLAAYAFPGIPLVDCAAGPAQQHKAVLRFRSDSVSKLTGIPFRTVTVRKGIWSEGAFRAPDIALANAYSRKCLGYLSGDRSVWNAESATRYIAPESFYDQLIEHAGKRICWKTGDDFKGGPLISTAPLPATAAACAMPEATQLCRRAKIHVDRLRVPNCDLYQTIYFPHPRLGMYRASITGDLLVIESADWPATLGGAAHSPPERDALRLAFGIDIDRCEPIDAGEQAYGKIVELGPHERKRIMFDLTHWHKIYSLGRFATWRNILLDDVVPDLDVIKRLLHSSSDYDLSRERAK